MSSLTRHLAHALSPNSTTLQLGIFRLSAVGSVCRSLHVLEFLLPQKSAAAALSKPICIVAAGFPRAKAGAAAAALYRRRGVGPASVRCSRASLPRSPMAATAAAAAPPRRARPRGARPHHGGAELATAALLAHLRAAAAASSPARGDGVKERRGGNKLHAC